MKRRIKAGRFSGSKSRRDLSGPRPFRAMMEALEDRVLLSATDYTVPGPNLVGTRSVSVPRTAGGSGSFTAQVYYPSNTAGTNTAVKSGAFPVVSFAHGYTSVALTEYPQAMAQIASWGYIVMLPRSYESFLDVLQTESLGHDLASSYNYLVTQNGTNGSPFKNHVETTGFAAMGHSMGGHSAISEASQNATVKTVVTWAAQNMANPVVAQNQIPNAHVPIQMIAGTNDGTVSLSTTTAIYNAANPPIILNNIVGGVHLGFYDDGPASQVAYTTQFSLEWLDMYMKGVQTNWRDLWGPEATQDAGVNYSVKAGINVTAVNNVSALSGNPGSVLDYTVRVRNNGDYATSYTLFAEDNLWNTTFSIGQTPVIAAGAFVNLHVFVTIPLGTPDGTIDNLLVSARNDTDGGTREYVALQSTAVVTNLPPTDIGLSIAAVNENEPSGTPVGTLSTTDADSIEPFAYELVGGAGSTDNGLFQIVGNQLQTNASFNYEQQASYSVRVRSTDQGDLSTEKAFVIAINDLNEAPTANVGGPYTLILGQSLSLSAAGSSDPDTGASLDYSWDINGDTVFGDATGQSPTLNPGQLAALGISSPGLINGVQVQVTDGTHTTTSTATTLDVQAASSVMNRFLFYKGSARYDTVGGLRGPLAYNHDNAIATDKTAYLPSTGTTATFTNITSYSGGINGIMVDLKGGGTHTSITLANILNDFTFKVGNNNTPGSWVNAPLPISVTVRTGMTGNAQGAGTVSGSDRVEIIWANNAIDQKWLEVIVKATSNTGLVANDVFFFGNEIGDSSFGNSTAVAKVDSTDVTQTQTHGANNANNIPLTNTYDYNRDGQVNSTDVTIAQTHGTNNATGLKYISVATGGPFAPATDAAAASSRDAASAAVSSDAGVASALSALPSLPGSLPAVPQWISDRVAHLDLNRGPLAKYFERLADEHTDEARRVLGEAQSVAEFLGLNDALLDSLLSRWSP